MLKTFSKRRNVRDPKSKKIAAASPSRRPRRAFEALEPRIALAVAQGIAASELAQIAAEFPGFEIGNVAAERVYVGAYEFASTWVDLATRDGGTLSSSAVVSDAAISLSGIEIANLDVRSSGESTLRFYASADDSFSSSTRYDYWADFGNGYFVKSSADDWATWGDYPPTRSRRSLTKTFSLGFSPKRTTIITY